ncbi:hypothetical protein DJ546_07875 [Enterobacter hormaechei]|nr:hypothetical protein DJ546_07875 [Enterobacter hormaechei]
MDHKNFSVLFFYKTDRQTAPALAAVRKTRTEKIEKNFSVFHFHGSAKDRTKNITNRKIREILISCELEGSFLFSGGVYSARAEARPGVAQGQRERYWQTEKVAHYNTGYTYSNLWRGQCGRYQLTALFLSLWPEVKSLRILTGCLPTDCQTLNMFYGRAVKGGTYVIWCSVRKGLSGCRLRITLILTSRKHGKRHLDIGWTSVNAIQGFKDGCKKEMDKKVTLSRNPFFYLVGIAEGKSAPEIPTY